MKQGGGGVDFGPKTQNKGAGGYYSALPSHTLTGAVQGGKAGAVAPFWDTFLCVHFYLIWTFFLPPPPGKILYPPLYIQLMRQGHATCQKKLIPKKSENILSDIYVLTSDTLP